MERSLLYHYLKEKNDDKNLKNNILFEIRDDKVTVHEFYKIVRYYIPLMKALSVIKKENPLKKRKYICDNKEI